MTIMIVNLYIGITLFITTVKTIKDVVKAGKDFMKIKQELNDIVKTLSPWYIKGYDNIVAGTLHIITVLQESLSTLFRTPNKDFMSRAATPIGHIDFATKQEAYSVKSTTEYSEEALILKKNV